MRNLRGLPEKKEGSMGNLIWVQIKFALSVLWGLVGCTVLSAILAYPLQLGVNAIFEVATLGTRASWFHAFSVIYIPYIAKTVALYHSNLKFKD